MKINTVTIAYYLHCDGLLFKSKQVAVIGGGQSDAKAAISGQVTLFEYADTLFLRGGAAAQTAQSAKHHGHSGSTDHRDHW